MANEFKIKTGLQIINTQPVTGISDSSLFTNDSSSLATINAIQNFSTALVSSKYDKIGGQISGDVSINGRLSIGDILQNNYAISAVVNTSGPASERNMMKLKNLASDEYAFAGFTLEVGTDAIFSYSKFGSSYSARPEFSGWTVITEAQNGLVLRSLGTNGEIKFMTGGDRDHERWKIDYLGNFFPWVDSAFDFGQDSSRVKGIYSNTLDVSTSIRLKNFAGLGNQMITVDNNGFFGNRSLPDASINEIWNWLDGVETVSRTIYFSTLGNDTAGNGTISTPYATLLKAVQTIKTVISLGVTITIQAVAGTYTFNWAPLEKEFSRFRMMNSDSGIKSIVINGSMTSLTSGFALSILDASIPYKYTSDAVWTPNAYQDKFLLVGANYYPIMSNDTSTLRTFVGLGAGTSIFEPGVIFNIQDKRINIGGDYFQGFQGGIQFSRITMNLTNAGVVTGCSISTKDAGIDFIETTITAQTLQTSTTSVGALTRSNIIGSITTTEGIVFTQNSPDFQLDYVMIRKYGDVGTTIGLQYNTNYQRNDGALYVSDVATGIYYVNGINNYGLSGRSSIINATTSTFSIRNGSIVNFGNNIVYLDGTPTNLIAAGETLYADYQFHLLTLFGTPSSFFTSNITTNGLVVPSKNICINVSGTTVGNPITFPDGTFQYTTAVLSRAEVDYASEITLDLSLANDFTIDILTGDVSLNVINYQNFIGYKWHVYLCQDVVGSRIVTLDTGFGKNFGAGAILGDADTETILTCWVSRDGSLIDYIITNE